MIATNQATKLIATVRAALMTIGTLLFVVLSVRTMTVAGSPHAAHMSRDVQPEIHAMPVTLR